MSDLRIIMITILLTILFVSGCSYFSEAESQDEDVLPIPVDIQQVQTTTLETNWTLTGRVMSQGQSAIVSLANGQISEVYVENGDFVSKGDSLIQLDDQDIELGVQQAQAAVDAAQANLQSAQYMQESAIYQAEQQLKQAEQAYDLAKEAEQQGDPFDEDALANLPAPLQDALRNLLEGAAETEDTLSAFELDNAHRAVQMANRAVQDARQTGQIEAAKANVKQAEIGLEMAKRQTEFSLIEAPIDGQVTNLAVQEGDPISPQVILMTIVNTSDLYVRTSVSPGRYASLDINQEVMVNIRSTNDQLQGSIDYISTVPQEQSLSYAVDVQLNEIPQGLLPGMIAQITLTDMKAENVSVVPIDAVIRENGLSYVFVADHDVAIRRQVETGIEQNQLIVIEEGLSGSEHIIVSGQFRVSDGAAISVREDFS